MNSCSRRPMAVWYNYHWPSAGAWAGSVPRKQLKPARTLQILNIMPSEKSGGFFYWLNGTGYFDNCRNKSHNSCTCLRCYATSIVSIRRRYVGVKAFRANFYATCKTIAKIRAIWYSVYSATIATNANTHKEKET